MASIVYFASTAVNRLDGSATLPAKFYRMLTRFNLNEIVKDKKVAIKMHLGNKLGYTTIHPLFVKILVDTLKEAGSAEVFITDGSLTFKGAKERGYTEEVLGVKLIPAAGENDDYFYSVAVDYMTLKEIQIGGNVADADVLINLAHAKGHGDCGYGGAIKNLGMGCVTAKTRTDLHALEGGLTWLEEKCTHCQLCIKACRFNALKFDKDNRLSVFYHHCTYCRHCVIACPEKAIKLDKSAFKYFQEGLALATIEVLKMFDTNQVLHINFLLNITPLCDCWGFSTANIVPDIGIMASTDIVAVEQATLDAIKTENFIKGSLPYPLILHRHGKHLFEKIHQKDPFVQVQSLAEKGYGQREYQLIEIE